MLYTREIFSKIKAYLSKKEILLLTGARQTGKTTLLKQLQQAIRSEKSTFFLNLENLEFVKLLNQSPENIFKIFPIKKNVDQKQFIFIDEVQYLDNPTNFLKYLYDEYNNFFQMIVSGSSSFSIDKKFTDSLAGRKKIFPIYPLSLRDFFIFKERSDIAERLPKHFFSQNVSLENNFPLSLKKDFEILLEEFMIYGSYPKVVLSKTYDEKKEVLEELVTSYVKKDIVEAGVKEGEKYYDLFKLLSSQIGGQVNVNELANTLNLSRSTINHYLYVMEKSYHFTLVRPFNNNKRKEIGKMPKGYFYDLGLRNHFINNFNPLFSRQDPGQILENFVFKQLLDKIPTENIRYWRTTRGEEIDFVVDGKIAIEVKYNAANFSQKKYAGFLSAYPSIPLFVASYLNITDDKHIWPAWSI